MATYHHVAEPGTRVQLGDRVTLDDKTIPWEKVVPNEEVVGSGGRNTDAGKMPARSGAGAVVANQKERRELVYLKYWKERGVICTTDESVYGNIITRYKAGVIYIDYLTM